MRVQVLAPILASAALAACGTVAPAPMPTMPTGPAPFRAQDFAWSSAAGTAAIDGRVAYRPDGQAYRCAGSVGLTPETVWTRARFVTLYGSAERAAVPAAVVRQRSVAEASADYRQFVRNTTCTADGGFRFADLPDGSWFAIAPLTPANGGEAVVVMAHVVTRAGRTTAVLLQ